MFVTFLWNWITLFLELSGYGTYYVVQFSLSGGMIKLPEIPSELDDIALTDLPREEEPYNSFRKPP